MRVRDHAALSTVGAALVGPRVGARVLIPWAASIAIDVDHYLWFCLRHRRLSPRAALRAFAGPEAPPPAARALHRPAALTLAALLARRRPRARSMVLGMLLHVALDRYHERRMGSARRAALRRDGHACQRCGLRGPGVGTHLWRQPRLLPSYRARDHVALCPGCHLDAHERPGRPFARPARPRALTAEGGR